MGCVVGRVMTALVVLTLVAVVATLPSRPAADKAQQFVDKCRSHCVAQTTPDSSKRSCLTAEGERCLRCWAACKAFQSERFIREYCKHNKACTAGCRQACLFYLGQLERRPVRSGQPPTRPPVTSIHVEKTVPPLVVGLRQGRPDSEPDSVQYSFVDGQRRPFDRTDTELPARRPVQVDWRPRLAGMTFTVSLVSATVSWPARGVGTQYLVTWELLSGGLRGHLVSAETTASLPLWPDEQYLVQVFCDEVASQPLQLDTHQKRHEAAREAVTGAPSEQVEDNISDAVPKEQKGETSMPDVGLQSYSDPESYSTDSDSEESGSTTVIQPKATTALTSSPTEPSSDNQKTAAELTYVSPLESAALMSADSDSDSSPTHPSSLPSGSAGVGERHASSPRPPLSAPTLLALLTVPMLLLVAVGVTLATRACSRSHQHRHHHHHHHHHQQQQQQQQQQRVAEADEPLTDDQRTLLDRRQAPRRAGAALHAPSDPRYAPIFIVPCHKR